MVIGNMDHFEGINYVDCWSVDGSGGVMKPIIKLTTGGTTGSTLAIGGYHLAASGLFEKVLIIGWEKNSESDTTGRHYHGIRRCLGQARLCRRHFGPCRGSQALHGQIMAPPNRDAARVSVRDRRHACNNPYAQLRKEVTLEEVLASPMLADPIHLLDVCPGPTGPVQSSWQVRIAEKITATPDWIWATANRHKYTYLGDGTGESWTAWPRASKELFSKAGIREPRKEIDVIELYQPYSFAGIIWIEDMGMVAKGKGAEYIWSGAHRHGRRTSHQSLGRRDRLQPHRRHRSYPVRRSSTSGHGQGGRPAGSGCQLCRQYGLWRMHVDGHDASWQVKNPSE